ncbi:hypothetical protein HUW51_18980 [Adhaeribacter swui]|uniref:Uncharacterized protein n=1 Tax=Adhaeribacter swui TaxID=2086471 RepID=A0A7G7GC26_9BACT|nr:DUF5908 family protein [Adhaeribacter swui]QNF34710.1 hypothetical protein HUW51_18980 [Adhaeribacter swui]
MPVQINEMVIRANIIEGTSRDKNNQAPAAAGEVNKEELVKECAALVLEILQTKNQR